MQAETLITKFDGGIASDPRDTNASRASMVQGFDISSFDNRLIPVRGVSTGDDNPTVTKLENFLYYSGSVFALGVGLVSGKNGNVYKVNNFSSVTWTALTNGTYANPITSNLWVEYKGFGYAYTTDNVVWKVDLSGGAGGSTNDQYLGALTQCMQGLVHSKDDILYVPYDNKIAKKDNTTWTSVALTLPSNLLIQSICEYGNYLAIGCKSTNTVGKSITYLWDRDTSLTTLSESIDFGTGALQVLENIEGLLVGISVKGSSTSSITPKIIFRSWSGGPSATVFNELKDTSGTAPTLSTAKYRVDGKLYFMMKGYFGPKGGTFSNGIWQLSRSSTGASLSLYQPNGSYNPINFALIGDYFYISGTDSTTGAYYIAKTFTASYNTGIYESLVMNMKDSSASKKLVGISVMHDALTLGKEVAVKYRKDEEISWTLILDNQAVNSLSKSAINIETTGITLPEFKEIQFRIESTSGAVVTGLKCRIELLDKDAY